jgi:hypothetical protein
MEEWEFGLDRVMKFPLDRKQSERTYLLKTLAGCPIHENKINKLLNLVVLGSNESFTENDAFLVFNMLSSSGSIGYRTLFKFLTNNWVALRIKYS